MVAKRLGDIALTVADRDQRWSKWMAAAQDGNRPAYEALLRECMPLLRDIARHQGLRGEAVDDAVQDTLMTLHRARHTYDPNRSFVAWLRVIARHRAIDVLRRQGRSRKREVHDPVQYESYSQQDERIYDGGDTATRIAMVTKAMAMLPPRQREAVDYLAVRQQSLAEASRGTGIAAGALRVSLHRGLKALRSRLGGQAE